MKENPANQNAAGTAMPIPEPDSGSLNIIAASGADPVTMQNRSCGSPSAFRASSVDPVRREPKPPSVASGAPTVSVMPTPQFGFHLTPCPCLKRGHVAAGAQTTALQSGCANLTKNSLSINCWPRGACARIGSMERLAGTRALVTGGTSGIGESIAGRLRSEGAAVVLTG